MTAFGHVCGSMCEVKQGQALSARTEKAPAPILYLRVKSVVAIAILVTVMSSDIFFGVSKVSTVTRIRRVAVAILVTVIVFELSYLSGVSKVSTVTRMSVTPQK